MRETLPELGVYALVVHVTRKTTIPVGRLGPLEFRPGVYLYVGSALNSLPGRIARHLRPRKKIHWHIDHLLEDHNVDLRGFAVKPTSSKIECRMSKAIQENAVDYIDDFGSSDCDCRSHLYRFESLSDAKKVMRQNSFQFYSRGDL